ncbi:MAG: hypothetical protein V1802_03600 [Candidatus Aenigmatarchaeota archaeon]
MTRGVDESIFYIVPVNADSYRIDSFKLAKQIIDSGFVPDFVLPIWRGGAVPFTYVTESLAREGFEFDHFPVQGISYRGPGKRGVVGVRSLDEAIEIINGRRRDKNGQIRKYKKIIVGDDVFDEGETAYAFKQNLDKHVEHDKEIKVATVYWKPYANKTPIVPDFVVRPFEKQLIDGREKMPWIVFPHEISDLSDEQLKRYYPDVYDIFLGK